jgi:hypothetical protein
MNKSLRYFAYISRSKVNQLYDQITDFAVERKSVKRAKDADAKAEVGSSALLTFLRGGLSFGARYSQTSEETGSETVVQKLMKIVDYIEANEKVLDLARLCERGEGVALNAFCYSYSGKFFALGQVGRETSHYGITISQDALNRAGDEIVISKSLLVLPGRQENALKESSPNNGSLVSDLCIVTSEVSDYTLSLACSFKYFSDMGGNWDEGNREWRVHPHSGNYHFFEGHCDAWFDSLIFINGIRGKTIMGTPLFLVYEADPSLRL